MAHFHETSTFEHNGHKYYASGTCHFSGPYREFEGVSHLIIRRNRRVVESPSAALVTAAENILEINASDKLEEAENDARAAAHDYDYDNYDRDDDYDRNYSSGPDYWVDRESGEWRCG